MKRLFLIIISTAGIFGACKKSHDFHRDNTTPTGVGSAPVSTNTLVNLPMNRNIGQDSLPVGYQLRTELQFFSESPVKEINVYNTIGTGTRTKVNTYPYAPAYSQIKKLDTLIVNYTVPTANKGTSIKLDLEILNQNNLSVVRTATFRVK